jgi:hypothetical protein
MKLGSVDASLSERFRKGLIRGEFTTRRGDARLEEIDAPYGIG